MKGKKILVTGGAGFIGSNMVELLIRDNDVIVLDNLSNVDERYVNKFRDNEKFRFIRGDINDLPGMADLDDVDVVIHLAANSDVKNGSDEPAIDFRNNVEGTFSLLQYMRKRDVGEILFASSSTVYGEASQIPTPEDYGPYLPISSYGASKMSCEGFITAYSHYYGIRGRIFRFANIVGKNSTHGVIYDFIRKLQKTPKTLEILGDGTQRKSYLHVEDCVRAMIYVHEKSPKTDIFNLGNPQTTSVTKIADIVVSAMGLPDVKYNYTGGIDGRGWRGDVKIAQLGVEKLFSTGWKNRYNSDESVVQATAETISQLKIN